MHIVQRDFDSVRTEWNCHKIRASRNSCTPSGHPNELYFMPHILGIYCLIKQAIINYCIHVVTGTQDYLCSVNSGDLNVCCCYSEDPGPPVSMEFLELAKHFMENNGYTLNLPQTVPAAINLYVDLTTYIDQFW